EGLVLSLAGGACGILAALWGAELLWRLHPPSLDPRAVSFSLDGRVLAFGLATVLVASLIVSLLPALQVTRVELTAALRGEKRFARWRARPGSLSQGLVAFQVALCALCLSCAGLLGMGYYSLLRIDAGFDSARLVSASFDLEAQGIAEPRGRE